MSTTQKRYVCQACGRKRVASNLEAVEERHGRYYQANKMVTIYVCGKERTSANGWDFLYCNGTNKRPEPKYRWRS